MSDIGWAPPWKIPIFVATCRVASGSVEGERHPRKMVPAAGTSSIYNTFGFRCSLAGSLRGAGRLGRCRVMSISQTIRPHLPYLRRFARTLTGNQEAGDAYVATLLEGLVATPSDFATDLPSRVSLYHRFLRVWNSVRLTGGWRTRRQGITGYGGAADQFDQLIAATSVLAGGGRRFHCSGGRNAFSKSARRTSRAFSILPARR